MVHEGHIVKCLCKHLLIQTEIVVIYAGYLLLTILIKELCSLTKSYVTLVLQSVASLSTRTHSDSARSIAPETKTAFC